MIGSRWKNKEQRRVAAPPGVKQDVLGPRTPSAGGDCRVLRIVSCLSHTLSPKESRLLFSAQHRCTFLYNGSVVRPSSYVLKIGIARSDLLSVYF